MFKPDSYRRGIIPAMLDYLERYGVYPVAMTKKRLDSTLIDCLYANEMQPYLQHWWVMEKAFQLGFAFPTIVVGKQAHPQHLCAYIRTLVGTSNPSKGMRGQLRYEFRGTHSVCNLIHAADDPQSALRETALFFDEEQLNAAVESIYRIVQGEQADSPNRDQLFALSELQPEHSLDLRLSAVCCSVSARIADMLAALLSKNAVLLRFVNRLKASVIQEQRVVQAQHTLQDEATLLVPIYQARMALLAQMKATLVTPDIYQGAVHPLLRVLSAVIDEGELKAITEDDLLSAPLETHECIILHTWWGVVTKQNTRLA